MPTPRIVLSTGGLVISRPGFDASNPALADANKVFDSDWAFGGAIVATGIAEFQDKIYAQGSSPDKVITFPEQPTPPAVLVYDVKPADAPINPSGGANMNPEGKLRVLGPSQAYYRQGATSNYKYDRITVTTTQIIIPSWSAAGSGWTSQDSRYFFRTAAEASSASYRRAFFYVVFGV